MKAGRLFGMAAAATIVAGPASAQGDTAVVRPVTQVYGTLSQNDVAIRLRSDELEIRFVPLDDRILGLLARDAAESLRGLLAARRTAIDSAARQNGVAAPGLALVGFFAQRDGVRFDPQLVMVTASGRVLRPLAVVPLSPRFGSHQLGLREQVMGLFLYEDQIPVDAAFEVSYESQISREWERRLPLLERERARIGARAR